MKSCAPGAGSFPVGLVKGDPRFGSASQKKEDPPLRILTELHSKDVRPIIRLDKHNLILVGIVEWLAVIHSDREVERSGVNLRDLYELRDARVLPSNQIRPSEPVLRIIGVASGYEY